MADIRIKNGKAWLGVSGFGVVLKIYVKTPANHTYQIAQTPANNPGDGTFGNGVFAIDPPSPASPIYLYVGTEGIGTYEIWAKHESSGILSASQTYFFDPDNFVYPGDPFDWNGDGNVEDLVVPAKWFTIRGIHRRELDQASSGTEDWDHIVVSTSSSCSTTIPNHRHYITVPINETSAQVSFSGLKFAYPGSTEDTFYAYVRDHVCGYGGQSNVVTIPDVTSSGGDYDVETLTLHLPGASEEEED